jgi:hypothetical protein
MLSLVTGIISVATSGLGSVIPAMIGAIPKVVKYFTGGTEEDQELQKTEDEEHNAMHWFEDDKGTIRSLVPFEGANGTFHQTR